jgi:hypothetical protein
MRPNLAKLDGYEERRFALGFDAVHQGLECFHHVVLIDEPNRLPLLINDGSENCSLGLISWINVHLGHSRA